MEHSNLILVLAIAFVGARIGAELAHLARMPSVVGEVLAGVVLGPSLLGLIPSHSPALETLAEVAVVFLLFIAGMETDIGLVRRAAKPATGVALLGMALPFGGGFLLARAFDSGMNESLFMATALVATSVGVTVQVMRDLGRLDTIEGSTIIGAAVIDDIGSLLLLGAVAGAASGGNPSTLGIVLTVSVALVGIVLVYGPKGFKKISPAIDRLKATEPVLAVAIAIALILAAMTEALGLAPIVGAFLAGLVVGEAKGEHDLQRKIEPLGAFLIPFFFVHIGVLVDLDAIAASPVWLVIGSILIAIAGKLLGGMAGAIGMDLRSRTIVGVGMVPRGEVGLIVAALGAQMAVGESIFGAVVAMVLVTTIVAPPFLKLLYSRSAPV